MTSLGELYEQGRERIRALVLEGDPGAAVPTCPGWRVRDVLAHVVGVSADLTTGNIAGATTAPWTAAQLEQRKDRPVEELLAEWDDAGPQLAAMADHLGAAGHELLFDLTTHEHDLRAALARPGARDHEAVSDALRYLLPGPVGSRVDGRGLPRLEVVTELGTFVAGSADGPPVRLEAPAFEVFRAVLGRRSEAQIRGYDWSTEPAAHLEVLEDPRVTMPPDPVTE